MNKNLRCVRSFILRLLFIAVILECNTTSNFNKSFFTDIAFAEENIPPPLPNIYNNSENPPPIPTFNQPPLPSLPSSSTPQNYKKELKPSEIPGNQQSFNANNPPEITQNVQSLDTKNSESISSEQKSSSDANSSNDSQKAIISKQQNFQQQKIIDVQDRILKVGTSTIDGIYYPLGSSLCLYFNQDNNGGFASNTYCRTISTSGSINNIKGLKEAELDLAIVKSNWQKQALNGSGIFSKSGKYDNLRFLFSLHDESLAIVVKRQSSIKALNDLPNKVINIGKPGSSVRVVMNDIMKSKGWSYNNFKAVTELEHKEEVEALCSGKIDAMILIVEHPNSYIKKVTGLCETNIININDNDIINFIHSNNEYKVTTIPGRIYLGISNDVQTIGLKATVVAPNDTSDDIVYKITKATFSHLDSLRQLHPALENLNMYSMLNDGKIAPMHNGVLKYLEEIGYDMNSPTNNVTNSAEVK